jgi:lipopolysaccharide export system protein LptA
MRNAFALLLVPVCAATSLARGAAATAMPSASEMTNTIITSDGPLEGKNDGVSSYFVLTDNVRLTGTNLVVTCDKLEVFADQIGDRSATVGKPGDIRRIVATGHVVISQEGRKATAGRVEVLPREDKIVLTEDPVVTQGQIVRAGETITFLRGEQKLIVDKPKLTGPPMRNLGFAPQPGAATDASSNGGNGAATSAPAGSDSGEPRVNPPPSTPPAPGG